MIYESFNTRQSTVRDYLENPVYVPEFHCPVCHSLRSLDRFDQIHCHSLKTIFDIWVEIRVRVNFGFG